MEGEVSGGSEDDEPLDEVELFAPGDEMGRSRRGAEQVGREGKEG